MDGWQRAATGSRASGSRSPATRRSARGSARLRRRHPTRRRRPISNRRRSTSRPTTTNAIANSAATRRSIRNHPSTATARRPITTRRAPDGPTSARPPPPPAAPHCSSAGRRSARPTARRASSPGRSSRQARPGGAEESGLTALIWNQVLSYGTDAMITVALASTVFFGASSNAQRGNVLLYLLITMAPFAVVAPVIGPVLDRLQHGRRWTMAGTAMGRGDARRDHGRPPDASCWCSIRARSARSSSPRPTAWCARRPRRASSRAG